MLICYLDESGNTGRQLGDLTQPFHVLAAVMVREDRIREMTHRLDALAARAPTSQQLIEYHGQELFGGSGVWEGIQPRQRIDQYSRALAVLTYVDAGVAYASINKPELARRGYDNPNPHGLALQFLTEKLEQWLRRQEDCLSQRALLVADENKEQEQYSVDLISEMQAVGGQIGASLGINISLDRVVDNVYFDRSDRNRGIQLADLVASILNRSLRIQQHPGDPRSDAAVRKLFDDHIMYQRRTYRMIWP